MLAILQLNPGSRADNNSSGSSNVRCGFRIPSSSTWISIARVSSRTSQYSFTPYFA